MGVLFNEIEPLWVGNGGPILMAQVENEFGSYPSCDKVYTSWLRDLFQQYIGDKAVLFTTDGAGSNFLKCGKIPGIYMYLPWEMEGYSPPSQRPLERHSSVTPKQRG